MSERESAPSEGTRLEFFAQSGSYLSDVNVTVTNASGQEVVQTVTEGPWLILDLPDGNYQVRAEVEDRGAQGAQINVGGDQRTWGFMFPDN